MSEKRTFSFVSILAVLFLSVVPLLNGCGEEAETGQGPGENEPGTGPIRGLGGDVTGTWDLTGVQSQIKPNGPIYVMPAWEVAADPLTYTFSPDNKGLQFYKDRTVAFAWFTNGGTLISTDEYSNTNVYTYSATATTMTLSSDVQDESVTYIVTHTLTRR